MTYLHSRDSMYRILVVYSYLSVLSKFASLVEQYPRFEAQHPTCLPSRDTSPSDKLVCGVDGLATGDYPIVCGVNGLCTEDYQVVLECDPDGLGSRSVPSIKF